MTPQKVEEKPDLPRHMVEVQYLANDGKRVLEFEHIWLTLPEYRALEAKAGEYTTRNDLGHFMMRDARVGKHGCRVVKMAPVKH